METEVSGESISREGPDHVRGSSPPTAPQGGHSPVTNFLEADPSFKRELVKKLAHSWGLVLATAPEQASTLRGPPGHVQGMKTSNVGWLFSFVKFHGLTEYLQFAQGFAQVLKGIMLVPSPFDMEEKVRQLHEGQQQAEDSAAKYKRY